MANVTIVRHEEYIAKMKLALAYGVLNLGYYVETQAKLRCPYKTGNLRRSIHTVAFHEGKTLLEQGPVPDYGQDINGTGVIVGTNAGYGVFVELGTVKMSAQPFLTPAAQEGLAQAITLVTQGAQKHWDNQP